MHCLPIIFRYIVVVAYAFQGMCPVSHWSPKKEGLLLLFALSGCVLSSWGDHECIVATLGESNDCSRLLPLFLPDTFPVVALVSSVTLVDCSSSSGAVAHTASIVLICVTLSHTKQQHFHWAVHQPSLFFRYEVSQGDSNRSLKKERLQVKERLNLKSEDSVLAAAEETFEL